jgi:hypothetical protein
MEETLSKAEMQMKSLNDFTRLFLPLKEVIIQLSSLMILFKTEEYLDELKASDSTSVRAATGKLGEAA